MTPPPPPKSRSHDDSEERDLGPTGDAKVPQDAERFREVGVPLESEFERFREGLRSFLKSRLQQESDIEDCVQSVSVKWIEHRAKIPSSAMRAWLFTVASNEAALVWRKHLRIKRAMQSLAENTEQSTATDDRLQRDETQAVVRRAVERLPDEMRIVVRMRLDTDATFEQIAERLQIPLGTALSRMHRALRRLEQELETLK